MNSHLTLISQTLHYSVDRFGISFGSYVLGRSSECELVVKDRTISRKHAEIAVRNAVVAVTDLGSSNGTYFEGQRVQNCLVRPGQAICFGRVTFALATMESGANALDSEVATSSCASGISAADERPTRDLAGELLSEAQRLIFERLLKGLTEKQIAAQLDLSPHTVHNHVQAIYHALQVHSRPQLLARFVS